MILNQKTLLKQQESSSRNTKEFDMISSSKETQILRKRKFLLYKIIIVSGAIFIFIVMNYLFFKLHATHSEDTTQKGSGNIIVLNDKQIPFHSTENHNNLKSHEPSTIQGQGSSTIITRFPKIFWIYTENELETEAMSQLVYLYHFNETATKFGYEVRIANSWNSYDWLSDNTTARISRAMQNSQVDEPVHNALKLALLMENGGILINQFDTVILGSSFAWVEGMFEDSDKGFDLKYGCEPSKAFLFMFHSTDQVYSKKFFDPFIASVPHSLVLSEAFDLMITFIMEGTVPFDKDYNIIQKNTELGVNFLPNSFVETINLVVKRYQQTVSLSDQHLCAKYGMQSRKIDNVVIMETFNHQERVKLLTSGDPENDFKEISDLKEVNLVRGVNSAPIIGILNDILENEMNNQKREIPKFGPGSILARVINAPVNRRIFVNPSPKREIELCLVVMAELDKNQVLESLEVPVHQTYQKWRQVMFVSPQSNLSLPKTLDKRVAVANSSGNMVRNIELAVTKHCDHKAYAVLLNFGEKFNRPEALAEIARAVSPRGVMGAFISLSFGGQVLSPKSSYAHFHRGQEAIINPKVNKLEGILNHLRVFAIESFRYIPQFDLRDIHGRYFEDRLIFLMTLLEMIRTEIRDPKYLYILKRYEDTWDVPRTAVFLSNSVALNVGGWEKADQEQLARTKTRLECEELQESIHNLLKWKIPFSKMLAFNDGEAFEPAEQRAKRLPELIPRVIHQVWLGTRELPPAKKYFYRKTRLIYPGYEIKLWREENITREAFPLAYDLIKNLIRFNKRSPYNKLATVTDVMRHQILYHEGGFWKDAGMNMLRPVFDQFTTYKIVIAADKTFRYRWLQGMCFFANMPKLENMWRTTNYRNINRMRIYHWYASAIAGPIDFRQFIVGQEEYHPDVLCMPYETFYPAQVTEHPLKDQCTKKGSEMGREDAYQIVESGWFLMSNCSDIYPYSYGVEHNRFGDSWSKRREIN